MGILKLISHSILYIIGIIIFATIIALGTISPYFYLQMFLFDRGNYLLFVSSQLNMVPVFMIIGLIIYASFRIKEKLFRRKEKKREIIEENNDDVDIETLNRLEKFIFKLLNKLLTYDDFVRKIFKVIKVCYIPALIIAIYCGMTSYAILYNDRIKVSSPTIPTGVIYKYSDIKKVDVGVEKDGRNSYSPYYNVIFYDGKSVNLFGGSMNEDNGKGFEFTLIDLDKKLRVQGVSKSVSKLNFEEYSKGLDKDFVSRVEKLFDDK